ncbi:uncharacterized protein LOC143781228 [Ranitomeya variabilis]|uniref:uncharacterized protein LOC143781228 n=1 Tax=Ranitomeya variabilis TaxID=490064 RepID=UPI004055C7E8
MEKLLQELVARAGGEDGMDWLRSCPAIKPPAAASDAVPLPPDPEVPAPSASQAPSLKNAEVSGPRFRRQKKVFSPPASPPASQRGSSEVSVKSRRRPASRSRSPSRDFGGHLPQRTPASSGAAGRTSRGAGRKSAVVPSTSGCRAASQSAALGASPALNPGEQSSDEEAILQSSVPEQLHSPYPEGWRASAAEERRQDDRSSRECGRRSLQVPLL